jgi:hypothetical protein
MYLEYEELRKMFLLMFKFDKLHPSANLKKHAALDGRFGKFYCDPKTEQEFKKYAASQKHIIYR